MSYCCVFARHQGGICREHRGHVLVTEFRGMAISGLFCADVLRPLDLVSLTNKQHSARHVGLLGLQTNTAGVLLSLAGESDRRQENVRNSL